MQKSAFSINFSTPTLMANCWCLWIKTTLQLRISSRFMYSYPFKHSLEEHTSWVASFNHFNHSNPDHYGCTCSAVFYHTGEAGTPPRNNQPDPIQFLALPGYFHIPLPWPDPGKHCRTPPAWTHISILFSRQCKHRGLVETGVYEAMLSNCFTWLCSLWSPSLKMSHSLQPHS